MKYILTHEKQNKSFHLKTCSEVFLAHRIAQMFFLNDWTINLIIFYFAIFIQMQLNSG